MRRTYGEISHYRAPYKNSVLSGFGDADVTNGIRLDQFHSEGFLRNPYEMLLTALQSISRRDRANAKAQLNSAARYVATGAQMVSAESAGSRAFSKFLRRVSDLFAQYASEGATVESLSGFGALAAPTQAPARVNVDVTSESFLEIPYSYALDVAEEVGTSSKQELMRRIAPALAHLDAGIEKVERRFDFATAKELMQVRSTNDFREAKRVWLNFLRAFRQALVNLASTDVRRFETAKAAFNMKPAHLSGFGANSTNNLQDDSTPAGEAAQKQFISGLISKCEEKPTASGWLRIRRDFVRDLMALSVMGAGRLSSMDSPLGQVLYVLPRKNTSGGYGVQADLPSLFQIVAYWSGRSGRPKGYSEDKLPSTLKALSAGDLPWVYVTAVALGDSAVPAYILSKTQLDPAKCGDAAKAAGRPGCEFFELFAPNDRLPAELAASIGETQMSTASILGYAALGVAVAAGALAIFARKRKGRATPNRRRRRRH